MTSISLPLLLAVFVTWLSPDVAQGQARDVVELRALHEAALNNDPRYAALELQASQSRLRQQNIRAERRPAIGAEGRAQYQSDVPQPPALGAGGAPLFSPPKGTVDTYLQLEQPLFDASIRARLAAEDAQLAEAQARTRTALFALRQEVNDAFFSAALIQGRLNALAASIADLDGRLRETAARVREGTALPLEAASVEATLLRRQQEQAEAESSRHAALARLAKLTGRSFADDVLLPLPTLADAVKQTRQQVAAARNRPEYDEFARTRERLSRQQDAVTATEKPRVSAFARAGYGRPGLNFINDGFDTYALGGVRVEWKALTWGTPARERQALALQQQIVSTDEAALTKRIDRSVEDDLAAIDRLERVLTLDGRIVSLREEIARTTEVRFTEGVVTAAEYLDRTTELLDARFASAAHRTELAQASARFLTTLGLEVR